MKIAIVSFSFALALMNCPATAQEAPETPRLESARAASPMEMLNNALPVKVGDQLITEAVPLGGDMTVKNDANTGFLFRFAANEKRLLQITKSGVVNRFFEFRGLPYLWTLKGGFYVVDPYFANELRSKRGFMILRTFNPSVMTRALGAGVGLWLVAYIGTAIPGHYFQFEPLTGWHGFVAGLLAYYGYDHGRTAFVDSPFSLGLRTNLFRQNLVKGQGKVVDVQKAYGRDDYQLTLEKKNGERFYLYLSDIMPEYAKTSACADRLHRLIMRSR